MRSSNPGSGCGDILDKLISEVPKFFMRSSDRDRGVQNTPFCVILTFSPTKSRLATQIVSHTLRVWSQLGRAESHPLIDLQCSPMEWR